MIHTVKSGEVLSVIAEKYNVGLSQVIGWNNITDAASLQWVRIGYLSRSKQSRLEILSIHGYQELFIGLSSPHVIENEVHGFFAIHVGEVISKNPHTL